VEPRSGSQAAILETILDCDAAGRTTLPYEPFERMPVGRTDLSVTRVGFGSAPIGGLYSAVSDAEGEAVVRHAWEIGVRYFDVAPMYGFGEAETRLGRGAGDGHAGDICPAHRARAVCEHAGLAHGLRKNRDRVGAGVGEGGSKGKAAVHRDREVAAAVILQHHRAIQARDGASDGVVRASSARRATAAVST